MPIVKCSNCGKNISDKVPVCPFCNADKSTSESTAAPAPCPQTSTSRRSTAGMKVANETVVQSASLDKLPEQDFVGSNKERSQPIVTAVLSILAALSLIGGILLCVSLWPEDTGSRYLREPVAYIPSAIALSVGIVESVLFYAFGQIIRYLSSADKNIGATKSLTEEILARIQQKGS